ncbi:heterokaryon incompatibility protein-domain-containing protein [Colletotrichum lupini]|nr:heterokaryon incompatibility protein-domain-containing protein [Colletotrichum lupini]
MFPVTAMSESATSFLSGENNLCSACASIDFDSFIHHAKGVVGKSLHDIDKRYLGLDSPDSPFALLVCDDNGAVEMVGIEVDHVEKTSACPCYDVFKDRQVKGYHTYLVYYLHSSRKQYDLRMKNKKLARPHLKVCSLVEVDRKPSPSDGLTARYIRTCPMDRTFKLVQPGQPDPKLSADLLSIKSALAREACRHHLKSEGGQNWEALFRQGLPGWSVIDCFTDKILNLEDCVASAGSFDAVEYATLSYVWGSAQSDCPRLDRKLPASVPRVIEDAKTATASLGFRYLWVDRYCIPQRCAKEALDQICNMNLIYARSCITIVAAAGQCPDYGLPGVGKTLRKVLDTFQIGPHTIRRMPTGTKWVVQQIQHSKWNTRAWTCQEAALSTRRLYFTDHFALLENGNQGESYIEGLPNQLCPKNGTAWDGMNALGSIPHAGSYATRELSFEADVFRAFQGCQSHYNHVHMGTSVLFCGIRIGNDCEFSSALLWEKPASSSRPQRRAGGQSWTWLGWHVSRNSELSRYSPWAPCYELQVSHYASFVPAAQVSLRYADGFTFKWASMTKERIYKLMDDRDEGTIEFILVTGLTFGFKALRSMSSQEEYIARAGSRANTSPGLKRAIVQWPCFNDLDEIARESYGISQNELLDESRALCLCIRSCIFGGHGQLHCLGLVSSDGGSTWQRLSMFKISFGKCRTHVCPDAFGWERRELKIR